MVDQQRALAAQAMVRQKISKLLFIFSLSWSHTQRGVKAMGVEIGSEAHKKMLAEQQREATRGVLDAMSRIYCNNINPDSLTADLVRKLFGPFGPIRGIDV